MRGDIGKIRLAIVCGLVALFGFAAAQPGESQPSIELGLGLANAWTETTSSDMGHHWGWNFIADTGWDFSVPLGSPQGETQGAVSLSFLPGFRTQILDIGASNWLSDGSRYRAWNAFGFGPELNLGLKISSGRPGYFHRIYVEGAFLANLSNYTNTTLYSAYTSWLVGTGWAMKIDRSWSVGLQIPVEFATRSDGRSVIAGISAGGRYAF